MDEFNIPALTDKQLCIAKEIFENIFPNENETPLNKTSIKYYLLEGLAGTGKTTLISELLKLDKFRNEHIYICAPTNKALSVIKTKIDIESPTWTYTTIFKLLGQKVNIDKDGQLKFNSSSSSKPSTGIKYINARIIIIDEASMIDSLQYSQLKSLRSLVTKTYPYIIFIGDRCQLPPVSEIISPIFEDVNTNIKKYYLTEILRSNSDIANLSNKIRTLINVDTNLNSLPYINLSKSTNLGKLVNIVNNKNKLIDKYVDIYLKGAIPIILTYTNNECENLNTTCREKIFKDSNKIYNEGELIIFNNQYLHKSNTSKLIKFNTSEQVRIKSINNINLKKLFVPDNQMDIIFLDDNYLEWKLNKNITTYII